MYHEQSFIEGLGCASYLVGCEAEGVAAVIDPDRDVKKYLDAAQAHGLQITHILETHLHADHVSGNTDLAKRTGAEIYIHEQARAGFPLWSQKALLSPAAKSKLMMTSFKLRCGVTPLALRTEL